MKNPILKRILGELLLIAEALVYLIVSFLCLAVCNLNSKVIGKGGSGFIALDIHRLNPFMLILGLLLFTALTVVAWEYFLKKQMIKIKSFGSGWFFLGIVLLVATGVLLFFDIFLASMVGRGLFSSLEESILSYVYLFYPMVVGVGYPLVRTLVPILRKRHVNNR